MIPRLADLVLRWSLPPGERGESIREDLHQEVDDLRAAQPDRSFSFWYLSEATKLAAHFALFRMRTPGAPTPRPRATGGGGMRPATGSREDLPREGSIMKSFLYDFRHTLRSFRKKPAFFSTVFMVFALGIGANTVIFSVVNSVLLRPLPYADPERLITPWQTHPHWRDGDNPVLQAQWDRLGMAYPVYENWLELSPVFEDLGIYDSNAYIATGGDQPERIIGSRVTHGVFTALGVGPLMGRTFLPEEDRVGGPRLVVLSHGFWRQRYGSDNSVLGQTLILDEEPFTIVGVMPQGFYFPGDDQIWTTFPDSDRLRGRNNQFAVAVARLKPGVSLEVAQREMEALAEHLKELYPIEGRDYGVNLTSLHDETVRDVRPALVLLLCSVGVFLVIACANIASLLLLRASERRKDLAVRRSLGAPAGTPRMAEITLDHRVLLYSAALSIITGVLVSVLPGLVGSGAGLTHVLRDSGRGTLGGRRRNRAQALLLVSEIALTFMLLVGAGLLGKSFARLTSVDRGFSAEGVFTMQVEMRGSRYTSAEVMAQAYEELFVRLEAVPGVTAVAAGAPGPFGGMWSNSTTVDTRDGPVFTNTQQEYVSASYFSILGVPLLAGRTFTPDEMEGEAGSILVNEALVSVYWPNENPIGQRLKMGGLENDQPWLTVVGVVGNVRRRLDAEAMVTVFRPIQYARPVVVVKTAIDPTLVMPAAREAVRSVDPNVPIASLNTLESQIGQTVAEPRVRTILLSAFALFAAVLAVVGIFGVLSYAVNQRTNEIGIRMALGAEAGEVQRGVLKRGVILLASGLAIGVPATLVAVRAVEPFLFQVQGTDVGTLVAVALLLTAAALGASLVPARRATRVDPVEALRTE